MSSVRDFGAVGDSLHDDSDAVQHAVDMGDGVVAFPPGDYLLTRTIEVDLEQRNRFALTGSAGVAKVIMAAAEPAFHLLISHCHIYHNTGVGVFFDEVNLHQAIISASHISYCLAGGIKIVGSEIRNLQITGNDIEYNDHNPDYRDKELCTAVRLADSRDCTLTGVLIQDSQAGQHTVAGVRPIERDGLLEVVRCRRINISGSQVLDGVPACVHIEDSHHISLTGCTLLDTRDEKKTSVPLRWHGAGSNNFLTANTIGRGVDGAMEIAEEAGVKVGENLVEEG